MRLRITPEPDSMPAWDAFEVFRPTFPECTQNPHPNAHPLSLHVQGNPALIWINPALETRLV